MLWYGGSIAEAVTLSKQRNAIFVVFVEGDNELSTEMSRTLDDAAISKLLSNESNFLVIKLTSGSSNYTHFAQIYQFVPVPSLFFIGRNGTPLEVVCAGVEANNLATRIDRILNEHLKEKEPSAASTIPSMQPSTSSQSIKEQTLNLIQSETKIQETGKHSAPEEPETSSGPATKVQKTEHNEVTKSDVEYEVVCDGDVCIRRPKNKTDEPGPSREVTVATAEVTTAPLAEVDSVASMEKKMERTKEMIEARRREKAEKEKEAEKQKEIERRSIGKGVAELKRWQAEQEFKQIQEERRREKKQNEEARQRILEQIAQDRAERKARDIPGSPTPTTTTPTQEQPITSGDAATMARVQFKLPDGSSHAHNFDADATLADVMLYVSNTFEMTVSTFALFMAFPRRQLVESYATLRELNIAPSATLLVIQRHDVNDMIARPNFSFANLIAFITQLFSSIILTPVTSAYQWAHARLFGPASRPAAGPARGPSAPPRAPPAPPAARAPRRRGNVHRLGGERGTDDDNNTWNGNSTQQM